MDICNFNFLSLNFTKQYRNNETLYNSAVTDYNAKQKKNEKQCSCIEAKCNTIVIKHSAIQYVWNTT